MPNPREMSPSADFLAPYQMSQRALMMTSLRDERDRISKRKSEALHARIKRHRRDYSYVPMSAADRARVESTREAWIKLQKATLASSNTCSWPGIRQLFSCLFGKKK